jgi:MFS family permease
LSAVLVVPLVAQEPTAEQQAQANNPLASFKTFNMHNYYVPKLFGLPDETSNTFWFRYAQPVGRFLVRASLPLATVPTGSATGDPESGLGDMGNGLMWPLIVALISDKAGSHQGAVQGLAGSTGAVAAIIGLLLGGLLYAPLQGWLFVVAASMIGVVGILALWSKRQPA